MERGTAVVAVIRLLIAAELYERYISPVSREGRESWWWIVYVLAAPLIFLPDSTGAMGVLPLAGLFCTRFVVECLRQRQVDWLFSSASTVAANSRRAQTEIAHPTLTPLLTD